MAIYRLFVEKKTGFDVHAKKIASNVGDVLGIRTDVRFFIRYDVEGISCEEMKNAAVTIFSEPPVDNVYYENLPIPADYTVMGVELLPGQYDQRADSAAQCVQLLTLGTRPSVKCANIYAFKGITAEDKERIAKFIINPVESRLCSDKKPSAITGQYDMPEAVRSIEGFKNFSHGQVLQYHAQSGFAMSVEDLLLVRDYFSSERRDPTETELKVIDTYWSDHCRHTTFFTELTDIKVDSENPHIQQALDMYYELFKKHNGARRDKYHCLMDMATIGVKELKSQGKLKNLDESEEINACSISVGADFADGKKEDWLVMFKNETHNHPTEIEPFGGAATCLGGAIRDPLSGRAYVYQSMRVSGAGDITEPFGATIKGKLPQRVISTAAASGFSSYGNQIGLATGMVSEYFHSGFKAKRMETGFVVAAAKKDNVRRLRPQSGDIVLLIGGETGRDGCGGATGSSKAHDISSIEKCGAEVQKGNPLTERKLQRLFRNSEFSTLVKRCNDFGAGGVSVAIGELADSLDIELDCVPKKYMGLSATELAISESQERMAVVVDKNDLEKVKKLCFDENVSVTLVAKITDSGRMIMRSGGKDVVNLSREFLNTNGAKQTAVAEINDKNTGYFCKLPDSVSTYVQQNDFKGAVLETLSLPSVCSQKGLVEMFDSTIGAGTILMPLGGKHQLTPSTAMSAKLPKQGMLTATVASHGYNPRLMSESCFIGAVHSVLESVIKAVAAGAPYESVYLSLQEYFEKLRKEEKRWGKPVAALLGALCAQLGLSVGAIGGKDSMSGSFENIDVPPTLISFALGVGDCRNVITNVITTAGQKLYRYSIKRDGFGMPDFAETSRFLNKLSSAIAKKEIAFSTVVSEGGAVAAIIKSCLGNGFGFEFQSGGADMFLPRIGDIILSPIQGSDFADGLEYLGVSIADGGFSANGTIVEHSRARSAFERTFEKVYPSSVPTEGKISNIPYNEKRVLFSHNKTAKPLVLIPTFPGTNCEYDTARKFEEAGAKTDIFVVKNLSESDIVDSVGELVKRIKQSNIIAFPGGFSGGDEPDGSGKFIATTFRNPKISDAVHELLYKRDGLILGICNGFQALIKLGLLPFGKIVPQEEDSATLTFNRISRHISQIAYIKVISTMSPWFSSVKAGEVYSAAFSHGEGRFVANEKDMNALAIGGQIATRYVDLSGKETMEFPFNPNGSVEAVEGIFSPDGRIFGKMGHSERSGDSLFKNVPAPVDMGIFASGVKYFK